MASSQLGRKAAAAIGRVARRSASLTDRVRRSRTVRRPVYSPPRGVRVEYAPNPDGRPDPGEIVWTWVPYEDDPRQGKDRPVLIIGRDGAELVTLMLTSKDHDRDAEQETRLGRHWVDIGTGDWDVQRRASEVRTDRLIRVDPAAVRREGAVLDRQRFDQVIAAAREHGLA